MKKSFFNSSFAFNNIGVKASCKRLLLFVFVVLLLASPREQVKAEYASKDSNHESRLQRVMFNPGLNKEVCSCRRYVVLVYYQLFNNDSCCMFCKVKHDYYSYLSIARAYIHPILKLLPLFDINKIKTCLLTHFVVVIFIFIFIYLFLFSLVRIRCCVSYLCRLIRKI